MADIKLSSTSYAVLGLLSFGQELSGYEIRKWAEGLRFIYWSPAQSQIYSELRKLSKLGHVNALEVKQEGKPDKRMYCITEEGHRELERWFNREPLEPTVVKHSLLLRLFFGHMADEKRLEQLLEYFISETQNQLAEIAVVQEFTEHDERSAYPALVAEWGYSYYQNELSIAQKMLEHLKEIKRSNSSLL